MLRKLPLYAVTLLAAALYTGCSSFEEGSAQTVEVRSFPAGADLYVNGEHVGQTPYDLELGRKTVSSVRVEKNGYSPRRFTVAPKENESADDFVKFGILSDLGYYNDLTPNPIEVQLEPAGLPRSRSADQYAEMVELIAVIDQQRENGEIGPVEHKYMVAKVLEYYSN